MTDFDPRALLEKVIDIDKAPRTQYRRIGGLDASSPGSMALSFLRKKLRESHETPHAEVEVQTGAEVKHPHAEDTSEHAPEEKTVPASAPPSLPPDDVKPLEEKRSTDQAPPVPQPPRAPGDVGPEKFTPKKPAPLKVETPIKTIKPAPKVAKQDVGLNVKQDVKQRDLDLWKQYRSTPTSTNLKPLMSSLSPLMHSEVNRWKASAPRPVLMREANTLTLDAINTYDGGAKGAKLSTHVMNRLKKLSRVAYQNQDLVRLPENKKLRSQALYNATTELSDVFGRDPTNDELADHLAWSPKRVSDVQRSSFGEYIESQDVGGDMFSSVYDRDTHDPSLDYVYYDLTPQDKRIFEHLTGYSGKPRLSVAAVASKLNLSTSFVRKRKSEIIDKVKAVQ